MLGQECPVFRSFCGLSELGSGGRGFPLLWDGSLQSPQLLDKEHKILLELSQFLTPPTPIQFSPQKPSAPPANKDSARSSTKLSRVSLAGLWASTSKTDCVYSHPLWSFTNYIFLPLGMYIDMQNKSTDCRIDSFLNLRKNTPLFIETQWPVGWLSKYSTLTDRPGDCKSQVRIPFTKIQRFQTQTHFGLNLAERHEIASVHFCDDDEQLSQQASGSLITKNLLSAPSPILSFLSPHKVAAGILDQPFTPLCTLELALISTPFYWVPWVTFLQTATSRILLERGPSRTCLWPRSPSSLGTSSRVDVPSPQSSHTKYQAKSKQKTNSVVH